MLIQPIAAIPKTAVKQNPKDRIILAHGEATGHHHSIGIDDADWWKIDNEQFLTVKQPTAIVHQEHAPAPLRKGSRAVIRQKEYTPQAIRNVAD